MSRVNTANNYDIKFADRVRSCEDAFLIEEEGLAILACDAGRERYNTVMVLTWVPMDERNQGQLTGNYRGCSFRARPLAQSSSHTITLLRIFQMPTV